nr:hypothetical protein [Pseudomonas sp. EGD-AKN5]
MQPGIDYGPLSFGLPLVVAGRAGHRLAGAAGDPVALAILAIALLSSVLDACLEARTARAVVRTGCGRRWAGRRGRRAPVPGR